MDTDQRISIQEVLATIRASTDRSRPFRLVIVVSTGRSIGSIRILAQCIHGAPAGSRAPKSGEASTAATPLHKERDTIPITDLEEGQYKTIPISHIIGFNQYKVYH